MADSGFEPLKHEATDLQSVPFDRLGNPPSFSVETSTGNLASMAREVNKSKFGRVVFEDFVPQPLRFNGSAYLCSRKLSSGDLHIRKHVTDTQAHAPRAGSSCYLHAYATARVQLTASICSEHAESERRAHPAELIC